MWVLARLRLEHYSRWAIPANACKLTAVALSSPAHGTAQQLPWRMAARVRPPSLEDNCSTAQTQAPCKAWPPHRSHSVWASLPAELWDTLSAAHRQRSPSPLRLCIREPQANSRTSAALTPSQELLRSSWQSAAMSASAQLRPCQNFQSLQTPV